MESQPELFPVITATTPKKSVIRQFLDAADLHGPLLPASLIPEVLGLSRQRIHQLVQLGKLPAVQVNNRAFVPAAALEFYLGKSKDLGGRPSKLAA
jgi:hypothetical protein